jgi:hypothetical protein
MGFTGYGCAWSGSIGAANSSGSRTKAFFMMFSSKLFFY